MPLKEALIKHAGSFRKLSTNRHSSPGKLSKVLDFNIPEGFQFVKEFNWNNSKTLEKQYDNLLTRAVAGGGQRGIDRHVKRNKKMLVRDRIKLLLDKDSEYLELSPFAGLDMEYGNVPCAGVVTLIGKIHGLWCLVNGNDATVKSGSIYPVTLKKQLRAQCVAAENRLPTIFLVDSGGAFLPLQSEIFNPGGRMFYNQAVMSSESIPQIALVCGSCTAGAAYIPTMADEAVILDKIGTIFLGGPPLVQAATGEKVSSEELGGATLHCMTSGCTDHFVTSEEEALETTRDVVATLNLNDCIPVSDTYNEPLYSVDNLDSLAPCHADGYQLNPKLSLACILDDSRFHEFKKYFGTTLVAGFGRVKGHLAGFLASFGKLSGPAALKGAHFVQLCSQRNIPLVYLQHFGKDLSSNRCHPMDFNVDNAPENASLVKAHAQLMQAVACASVPAVTITTGGTTGSVESQALGSLSMGSRFHFTYPSVRVSGYNSSDLAVAIAHQASDTMSGPEQLDAKKLELFRKFQHESSAFYAATRVRNDGVILPRQTRNVLAICLNVFEQEAAMSRRAQFADAKQTNFRM